MISVPKVSIGDGDVQQSKDKKVLRKWYNFQVLTPKISILSGSFSTNDKYFKFASRGRQAAPCAIIAIVLGKLFEPKFWKFHHVDQIIKNGDKLYRISKARIGLNSDDYLTPVMVHPEFFIDDYKCSISVEQSGIYGDFFSEEMTCPDFTDGLQRFFKFNTYGVITAQESTVAIWRDPKYGFFYFDPFSCNEKGERITSNGTACLMRFKCITDLQELFLSNMDKKLDTQYYIDKVTLIYVDLINRDAVRFNQFAVERIISRNIDAIEVDGEQFKTLERTKSAKMLPTQKVITKEPLTITISNYNIDTKFATAPIIDQNNFNTGFSYYNLKVNIPVTFIELTDDRAILHGRTHEGNEMYKGKGGQSVANCIMAIGMKKVHPVNTWLPTTLDEILTLGDALYIEIKKTMFTTKSLNAADFDNTEITIEGKKYYVNVDLLTIVGTISSKLPSILNIKQALEEFFLINKDGIIEFSSMANAVWTDDDFFYMFNPRECDDVGIRVTERKSRMRSKSKKKNLSEVERRIEGKSCVMRYPSIDAVVAQFLKNLDSGKKNDRFIMRHLTIMDDIPGTRPWYDFQPGKNDETWVLSGNLSNKSGELEDNSRGIQGIVMPIVALIYAMEIPPNEWTKEILDEIIHKSNDYYNWCIGSEEDERTELSLRKLKKKFYIKNRRVKINIQESLQIGDIKAKSDSQLPNLSKGIMQFFDTHKFGIVQVKDLSVAIWEFGKEHKVKSKSNKQSTNETSYYYFDPNPRNKIGQRIVNEDEEAAACVIRAVSSVQLAHCIEMNIDPTATENDEFVIHSLEVESISGLMTPDEIEQDKAIPVKADLNAYTEIGDDGAYLKGNFDQSDVTQFKPRTRNKQQAANALVTLAMCQLHSPFLWNREVIDDILKLGDKITEENLINLPVKQNNKAGEVIIEPLRDYLLPSEINETFNVGVNRVTISIDEVIDTRPVGNITDNLNEFFDNNSMGILRQQNLMFPIWVENDIYFIMDPNYNRFHQTSKQQNGTATVFWFTSLSSLAAHIQKYLINSSGNIIIYAIQLKNEFESRLAENVRPKRALSTESLWHNFSKKVDGIWELIGNISLDSDQLPSKNTDNQSAALAIMSIIFSKVYDPQNWTKNIVDEVVISGNKLHEKSIARLGDDVTTSPRINQILPEFFLSDRRLNITIRDCVEIGKIDGELLRFQDLKSACENFFRDNTTGAITLAGKLNIAIWKRKDYYYCLIPRMLQSDSETTLMKPRVVRFSNIGLIVNELKLFANINDDYEIHGIDVIDWNKLPPWKFDPSPAIRPSNLPSLNAFKQLQGDARAILRGGIHEESDIFPKSMRNHRSAANCVVAIGMSVIKNPVTWTKKTLDDILVIGYNVHSESLKVHPEKQKLKPPDVIRIFRIGVNVLTADVDEWTLCGQVAVPPVEPVRKGRKKPLKVKTKKKKKHRDITLPPQPSILLEEGLKVFFENNHAGILVAGRLMVAVWKEQGIYFIYDPHKRSDQGLADENGTACVMWFACINPFYTLIFENIDLADKYGRYIIYRTIISTTIIEPLPCPVGFQPFFDTNHPLISIAWLRKTTTVALKTLSKYFHVDDEFSTLLGTISMCHPIFDLTNRGFQSTAIAAVAIAVSVLHVPSTWTAQLIDSLLKYGDILHRDSVRMSRSGACTLPPSKLLNVFIVGDVKASILIDQNTTAGILLVNDLVQSLTLFFRNNCAGILYTQNLAVAIMQHCGKFYLFNPSESDKFGNFSYNGAACVTKCDSILRLVLLFVKNCNYKVPCVYTVNTVNVLNLQFFSHIRSKTT